MRANREHYGENVLVDNQPLSSLSLNQLKNYFTENSNDIELLKLLLSELTNRKRKKARRFSKIVSRKLVYLKSHTVGKSQLPSPTSKKAESPTGAGSISSGEIEWDSAQRAIVELDSNLNSLVEAGPGTGKTAVACARVANLVEDHNIESSNIMLISFTRTAVGEIRERIEAFASNPIELAGLNILTLDSFTWQVVRGITDDSTENMLQSYEGNLKKFIELIDSKNDDLMDYLDEIEHIILDEGQDLVGLRAELTLKLINSVPEHCGVTVFADSAQAIYGFTNDHNGLSDEEKQSLAQKIRANTNGKYKHFALEAIYRTDDVKLKKLFTAGRKRLLESETSSVANWKRFKDAIENYAHKRIEEFDPTELKSHNDTLILFRTRSEVLQQSSELWKTGVPHKLRMSNVQIRIHPWIGRIFSAYPEDKITKEKFFELWSELIDVSESEIETNRGRCWDILAENASVSQTEISVVRLREILSRTRPPIDFLVDEKDLPGPTLGTIHSSKGREADRTILVLPPNSYVNTNFTGTQIAEEERVLFVGASRSKKELWVGKIRSKRTRKLDSNRVYKKYSNCSCDVEIGICGDYETESMMSGDESDEPLSELQDWLWNSRFKNHLLVSEYNNKRGHNARSLLRVEYSRKYIGALSPKFSHDLFKLQRTATYGMRAKKWKPSSTVHGIRLVGVTTTIIPPEIRASFSEPYCDTGFVLTPVISGFTKISFHPTHSRRY